MDRTRSFVWLVVLQNFRSYRLPHRWYRREGRLACQGADSDFAELVLEPSELQNRAIEQCPLRRFVACLMLSWRVEYFH